MKLFGGAVALRANKQKPSHNFVYWSWAFRHITNSKRGNLSFLFHASAQPCHSGITHNWIRQYGDNPTASWQIYETTDQAPAYWCPFTKAETRSATRLDAYLLGANKGDGRRQFAKCVFGTQKHNPFARMTGIEDQKDLLASIKRKEDAFQQLQIDLE